MPDDLPRRRFALFPEISRQEERGFGQPELEGAPEAVGQGALVLIVEGLGEGSVEQVAKGRIHAGILTKSNGGRSGNRLNVHRNGLVAMLGYGPVVNHCMNVRLLLFAVLQDIVGSSEISLQLTPGTSALDVWKTLREKHHQLVPFAAPPMTAINQSYAPAETVLRDGDELAFIPPVSGG